MRTIGVRNITTAPQDFDGQAVIVEGRLVLCHENFFLDDSVEDDEIEDIHRIWLDGTCDFLVEGFDLRMPVSLFAGIEGVYRHGTCGHRGRYSGQITQIRRITATNDTNAA
jgi:hypothetical protein